MSPFNDFQDYTDEFSRFYDCADDEFSFEELNPVFSEVNRSDPRYSDFSEIGRGGMKRISRVYDRASGRTVAMARLYEEAPREGYEAFLREARLTACLQHPNIIPVYDVGILDGAPYFTMELKSGHSLEALIRNKSLESERALEIFIKVCDAISYAHSRSVLHLDLKPSNIQVGEFGEVMVCDWGLGKILYEPDEDIGTNKLNPDMLNNMSLTGEIRGTPGYMAPEQIERNGTKSCQTDVYAMGALLFSLLTFRNPTDENVDKIFEKTRKGTLFTFEHTKVPKSLRAIVVKATSQESKQRYQSIADLRNDVHRYLSGFPTFAEKAGFTKQLFLLFKRNKRSSFVLLTVSLFTLGITLFSFNAIRKSADMAQEAKLVAESERDAARNALEKYIQEKEYSTSLVKNFEKSVLGQADLFQTSGLYSSLAKLRDYERIIGELDKVLAKSPTNRNAIFNKGKILVVMQRFEESDLCYSLNTNVNEPIVNLVKEFAEKYPGNDLKESSVIVEFIRQVRIHYGGYRVPLAEKMMAYDSLVRKDMKEHSQIVREVVRMHNQSWDNETFEYNADKRSLTIGGRNLESFISNRSHSSSANILRTLKIDTLTIKSPEFVALEHVSKLPLASLDIRNTGVNSLSRTQDVMLISEIICRKDQFSADEKAGFPPHLRVVEK